MLTVGYACGYRCVLACTAESRGAHVSLDHSEPSRQLAHSVAHIKDSPPMLTSSHIIRTAVMALAEHSSTSAMPCCMRAPAAW